MFRAPFQIQTRRQRGTELTKAHGNYAVFIKPLSVEHEVPVNIHGFGGNLRDAEIVNEKAKVGAGARITGGRPPVRDLSWAIRTVPAIELYIAIDIQPGAQFTWAKHIRALPDIRGRAAGAGLPRAMGRGIVLEGILL